MLALRPLDTRIPIEKQLGALVSPVILINLSSRVAVPNLCAA